MTAYATKCLSSGAMIMSKSLEETRILTINSGSSSVKLAVYRMEDSEKMVLSGKIDRIGLEGSHFEMKDDLGKTLARIDRRLKTHEDALDLFMGWLKDHMELQSLDAAGHRLVHGGSMYTQPTVITPDVFSSLKELIPLAPGHLPQELKVIEAIGQAYPNLNQVACFDTAFHRGMPKIAQTYALPRDFYDKGIIRYGFHGLSCEYLVAELRRQAPRSNGDRWVIAHLGNGASMTAIRDGKSVETTMGFTPAGGLMMSTRSGDLDPGVLVYLLQEQEVEPSEVNEIINQRSGLLGVSGISSDMQDLLERGKEDPHAALAIGLFCYQAKKYIGSLAAVLGGLDTLVFTAGIGENAPAIRWRICEGLGFLGIHLDSGRNAMNAPVISAEGSPCTVRVMRTDEDLMIARHTLDVIEKEET